MKIKLSNTDVVEIAKAIKSGWLDLSKVASFKSLLDGYNPTKPITAQQLDYFIKCLYRGVGYIPNDEPTTKELFEQLPPDEKEKWAVGIENGQLYRMFIKDIFVGMVALKAIGGRFVDKEPDFGFIETVPDFLK